MAATEFKVVSPLGGLTKAEVRELAKFLGLPNWNTAASPCLRSRLQFGVEATQVSGKTRCSLLAIDADISRAWFQTHLQRIEASEEFVRRVVGLEPHMNMRVRFLAGNRAAVGTLTIRVRLLLFATTNHFLVITSSELDREVLEGAMKNADAIQDELCRLGQRILISTSIVYATSTNACMLLRPGFTAVEIRAFRSGSLSGYTAPSDVVEHTAAVASA